jgi:hypothetical protein
VRLQVDAWRGSDMNHQMFRCLELPEEGYIAYRHIGSRRVVMSETQRRWASQEHGLQLINGPPDGPWPVSIPRQVLPATQINQSARYLGTISPNSDYCCWLANSGFIIDLEAQPLSNGIPYHHTRATWRGRPSARDSPAPRSSPASPDGVIV